VTPSRSRAYVPGMNAPADDPFDTAAELESEARMMESRAGSARETTVGDTFKWKAQNVEQYDAATRAMKAAQEEARAAQESSRQARESVRTTMDDMAKLEDDITQMEKEGKLDDAQEAREELYTFRGQIDAMETRADTANKAAQAADARAATHAKEVESLQDAMLKRYEQMDAAEKRFDEMEDSAMVMRTASVQLAEAERLDAAAADLEARGVAGADRVRAAAQQARAEAAASVDQARKLDPTQSYGTTANEGIDESQIEITTGAAVPASDLTADDGVDIEIDEVDLEIERELEYLQPLEPAPEPILTPEQVEPVALAPNEPVWDDPVQIDVGADPMPSATFAEEPAYEEPTASPGLDEVGDDPVFDA